MIEFQRFFDGTGRFIYFEIVIEKLRFSIFLNRVFKVVGKRFLIIYYFCLLDDVESGCSNIVVFAMSKVVVVFELRF